ncbi:MAG: ABC transporter substrate-binding protein [Chloroflexi bacterium]|nr:ABC transporter substrate-binding protein [Chloroflexota bacterium]
MHTSRLPLQLAIVLLLLATLTACTAPAAPPPSTVAPTAAPAVAAATNAGPTTMTDALGRAVTFQRPPQRIALVGRALFMVADAAYLFPEAGARITAIGSTSQMQRDFIPLVDAGYGAKTQLGPEAGPEQIAAVQPDAVILKSSNAEKLGKPLETLGIPVVYVDFETPEQYQRDLQVLGQVFGNTARGQELAAYFRSHAEKVASAVAGLKDEQKPRVLLMYYTDRDGAVAFNVPPLAWMQTLLVEMAGGRPVWRDAQIGAGWTKVGLEQIAAWDPDQICVVTYTAKVAEVVTKLKADPQWQLLRAVKAGRLYAFPGDFYSWDQPDTRWTLGLTWLAGKIHPDRFPDLDMGQEARRFYRELYGLDDAAYDQHVQPILFGDLP